MAKKKTTGNKGDMKTIIMSETNIQEQPGPAGLPIVGISDSTTGGTLKESEENFRTFVETIDDMVIVATREGRILFTNKSFKRKLGYSAGELAAMHVLDVHPSDKRQEAEEIFAAMFRGERESCPLPLARKDGSLVPVETRAWFGKWNGLECIFGISKDLTNEQEALQKFNRLFICNPAPMAVSSLPDRRFTDVNDAFLNTISYSREEVIGKTSAELGLTPHPERHAEVACELLTNEHIANFELQVRRKDGSILDGIFSGEVIISQGKKHFLTVMIDQTERKQAEEALKDNEELLRQVLENSQDSAYKRNLQTDSYDYMSPVFFKIFGYTPDEMKTIPLETLMDLIHPEDLAEIKSVIADSVSNSGNMKYQMEYRFKHKDGKYRWLQDRFTVMRDGKGQPLAIIGTVRDITEHKKTEEALQESEEKYRGIFDESIATVYVFDNKKNFINTNQAGLDLLGYSREELLHMSISDVDADPAVVFQAYQEVLSGGRLINYEHRLRRKDGTIITVLNNSRPIKNPQGNVVGMFITMMDITERKQAEDALLESEERFQMAISVTKDGIWEWDIMNDNEYFSPRWCEILGYSFDDPELSHTYTSWSSRIHPDDLDRVMRTLKDHLEKGAVYDVDYRHRHKSGEYRWQNSKGQAIFDESGKPVKMGGCISDITRRKQAEDTLRESEESFRLIFENNSAAMAIIEPDTTISMVNDEYCKMSGYTKPEVVGMSWIKQIPPEDLKRLKEYNRMRLKNPKDAPKKYEFSFYHKNGEIRHALMSITMLSSKKMIASFVDITERKQAEDYRRTMEDRLQRAEKMEALGLLAGGVAHDLNDVLGIVVGYAELLVKDTYKTNPIRDDLLKIMDGSQKAAVIVQDLLTLARRGVTDRKVFNLNSLILDYQKSPGWEKLLSYHPLVRIKADLSPDLLNISASSIHLEKTLFNLVSNACDAMPKGGDLTIKTTNQYMDKPVYGYDHISEGDYVVLSITDTGKGIPVSDLKRIFEPFHTNKVMGRSGSGLGLSVVWGTVKDHQGYIEVQSEEKKGTTFVLYFPVTREEITTETPDMSMSEYMGRGESILVVDDVKGQRELATAMLKKLNYKVESAASGEHAVEYVKKHKVDLIVLDMILDPDMDGLDTYMAVLKIHPKQKAIIVSGFSESDRVNAAQALGAGAYVKKPYVIEKLGMAVKNELAAGKRKRKG